MTSVLIAVIVVLVLALGLVAALFARERVRRRRPLRTSAKRIMFPFVGRELSQRALDAALRLAKAEGATLVPVFLAQVPLNLPLDKPLARQCGYAMPLLDAIEQRAAALGVPVDARVASGRNHRHALREAIDHVSYDRIVAAATPAGHTGLHPDDVAWLLDNAPGEIVIVRPAHSESLHPAGRAVTVAPPAGNGAAPTAVAVAPR